MSELGDALKILDSDDDYKEKIAELTAKIDEYKKLIKEEGGFNAAKGLTLEAQRDATTARSTLQMVMDEAEIIIAEAKAQAKEIEKSANERSVKINYLADQSFKVSSEKESALKKLKVKLGKENSTLTGKEKSLERVEILLRKREAEVARKESILAQL